MGASMFALEVCYHNRTEQGFYDTKEEAERELKALLPKLGSDRFMRNNDTSAVHLIATPAGDWAVVCDKVESTRVVDWKEWIRTTSEVTRLQEQKKIDFEIKKTQAMLNSGLTP
jgi:hypothetical protein